MSLIIDSDKELTVGTRPLSKTKSSSGKRRMFLSVVFHFCFRMWHLIGMIFLQFNYLQLFRSP